MTPEQIRLAATGSPEKTSFDLPYFWGRTPAVYLSPREMVRLTILRSRLDDRHLLRNRAPGSHLSQ